MTYILSYHLQKKIDADFYAVYDLPNKTKTFFDDQKLVNYKKIWHFHDQMNFKKNKIDTEYLSNFEKKYGIGLWNLAINERLFYRFNAFNKFSTEEIWSILEQECKFFENILDEVKPDLFISKEPLQHHDELFYQMCRAKGIKTLVHTNTQFANKSMISEHPVELYDSTTTDSEKSNTTRSFSEMAKNIPRSKTKSYNKEWHTSNKERLNAAIEYLFNFNNNNAKTHFTYFGRSKHAVLLNAIKQLLQKQSRSSFLNKNASISIDHSEKFIYFPLGIDEEHSLLITHYQIPAYNTNQIETIRHVAKSIPVNYRLYVKEHPSSVVRNWRSISDYKEIMNIPNVKLIHPSVSQDELFRNCSLVISAKGSSCLEAIFHGKPSIVFEKVYYSILPSVHHVETLRKLPEIIRSSLEETVNLQDVERFLTIFKKNSFDFDILTYNLKEANTFFYNGHLVDVKITESQMKSFIEENTQMFSVLVDEYIKKLKTSLLSK
tara:strand:- start:808 stop:2280 length:1473 start_codon:yes stop_codon:yes gene_type:complete